MLDESMIPYVPRKQSTHFFSHASQFQWLELPVVPSIDSNRLHPCIEMPSCANIHVDKCEIEDRAVFDLIDSDEDNEEEESVSGPWTV